MDMAADSTINLNWVTEPIKHDDATKAVCSISSSQNYCCDSKWVFCIDATCSPYKKGADGVEYSDCSCWIQDKSQSIGPAEGKGAPAITGKPGGKKMCDYMQSGGLVSTF